MTLLAAGGHEECRLRPRLYAVADDIGAKLASDLHAGTHGSGAGLLAERTGDEPARQLQPLHGRLRQIAEAGIAVAEIVDGHAEAESAQAVQRPSVALRRMHEHRLAEPQFYLPRRDAVLVETRLEVADEVRGCLELAAGDVDGEHGRRSSP